MCYGAILVNHVVVLCMMTCEEREPGLNLSLRHCQQHIDEMKADACANSMFDKDARKFWRNVHRMSNAKTTTNVITVGGKVGSSEIAN